MLFLLVFSPATFAWNNTGHMLIAEIAYEQLSPEVKERVEDLSGLLREFYPYNSRFVRAAVWADWLKGSSVHAFDSWHYIDLPYAMDATVIPPYTEKHHIVWAIEQSLQVLRSRRSNTLEKALFLRFLVHFVGDIHQPLHTINGFSQRHPRGDRGGNYFSLVSPYGENLHRLWDQGLGYLKKPKGRGLAPIPYLRAKSTILQQQYPRKALADNLEEKRFMKWAEESHQIAIKFAYNLAEGSQVDAAYLQQGQELVKQQVILAGYRLGDLLNQIFQ